MDELPRSNTGVDDEFGWSVGISGDTVVVGALNEDGAGTGVDPPDDNNANASGAAYVFVRDGEDWTQQAYLKASNTGAEDLFGISAGISGDTVVVGAWFEDGSGVGVNPTDDDNANNSGAVYAFDDLPDRSALSVNIDIQFCGDPNALNCKKNGVVPVTIFGNGVDVSEIDVSSLRLCLASNPSTCTASGPGPWSIADRGDPDTDIGAGMCTVVEDVEQDYLNQDGIDDLDVGFDAREVAELIDCEGVCVGDADHPRADLRRG